MRRSFLFAGAMLAASLSLPAQSPLTTLFAWNNGGATGWTMYFDLTVNVPVTITQIAVNLGDAVGTNGTLDVHWLNGTYVGNDTNAAAWTLGGSGPVTAAGLDVPSTCPVAFPLTPGNYGIAIVHNGVSPYYTNGNGSATPGSGTNQTYSTNELTLLAGASAGGGLGTAICCTPRVVNCSMSYSIGASGTVATRANYGAGCYDRFGSFYELFSSAPSFDLSNSAMTMIPTGAGGYTILGGIANYVAPSATAATLTLGDDTETTVTLTTPFPVAGGVATSLNVCSNGFVSVGSNGTGFTPVVATMLAAANTGWWCWHDYNPAAGGAVRFEQVAGVAYVTWDGVYDFGGTSSASANTFQMQFDTNTGFVNMVWQTMSLAGNAYLVGYSPGGASLDPGSRDLSASLAGTFTITGAGAEGPGLTLRASGRPVLGTSISLVTSEIPAGTAIGGTLLGFAQFNPGIDLTVINMPGCFQFASADASFVFLPTGGTASVPFSIPNNLAFNGAHVFVQSATFTAGFNAFGAISSNGVDLGLGNL